jgi:transposase
VSTILGAITLRGLLCHRVVIGGTSGKVFESYVKEELVPKLRAGQVVVWDNLAAHKQAVVREAVEAVGARVVFQPPYSPEFNPIECCWSKVKHLLRKVGARTVETLWPAIAAALAQVSADDAEAWFGHCGFPAQRD